MSTFPSSSDRSTALAARFLGVILSLSLSAAKANAQPSGIDDHIHQLDAQIAQAAAAQHFEAAAGLQRDRTNWLDLKHAIEAQDAGRILALQAALQQPYIYQAMAPRATTAGPAPTTSGPEFMHQVYTLEADGSYQPLEKQEASNTSSGGGYGGFGGKVSSLKVAGDRSNVRFEVAAPRFVVTTYPGQDPSDILELVKFDVRGARKDRYVDMSKSSHAFYHHSSSQVTDNRVRLAFKNLGDQVYEVVIDGTLEAGEYAFMQGRKVFAFGMGK